MNEYYTKLNSVYCTTGFFNKTPYLQCYRRAVEQYERMIACNAPIAAAIAQDMIDRYKDGADIEYIKDFALGTLPGGAD